MSLRISPTCFTVKDDVYYADVIVDDDMVFGGLYKRGERVKSIREKIKDNSFKIVHDGHTLTFALKKRKKR